MSATRGLFVTGTDTGVGKTVISLGLMQALQDRGLSVAALKPVASGCERTPHGLRNDDALQLQQQASIPLAYEQVNPYAFEPPIAPHLAAEQAGQTVEINKIYEIYQYIASSVDVVIVEGVGGWQVPLNSRETVADLAHGLGLDICLVVGLRLGCINHALLSAQAIDHRGCTLAGWVANALPPTMDALDENINTLKQKLSSPLLGVVPVFNNFSVKSVAHCLQQAAPLYTW
ncbi:MAG: dethiobiotin synthase [Gammaproteobacteria bacterium]|nr:dethiobiotin synthase [Gammaproteobacteria bacterium]